ncbi:MAG TPA: FAD:protein FMN transferase [Opitutales bacterium]|nr:FAD:protein FMN transferase [Opitutales bacterium]
MEHESVRVARFAMGTRFEILLWGADKSFLRGAAEEALNEVERLERQLNLFQPTSEVSRINRMAANGPVRVEPALFELLEEARKIWETTNGAFDLTVGPLMDCWGFRGGNKKAPSPEEIESARKKVGFQHVELDRNARTIFFKQAGVSLDFGAIAKGWALDEAAMILQDHGIENALLHGGTSTIRGIGDASPDAKGWKIAIQPPPPEVMPDEKPWPESFISSVILFDEALSVSGIGGRFLRRGSKIDGHVLDPRSGEPVRGPLLAGIRHRSATKSDALSTALLAGGETVQEMILKNNRKIGTLFLKEDLGKKVHLETHDF